MENSRKEFIEKIEALLEKFPEIENNWYSDSRGSGFRDSVSYEALVTEVISLVTYIYGRAHPHTHRVIYSFNQGSLYSLHQMKGVLIGTKNNLINGLLDQLESKILLGIKNEFLEMSNEQLSNGQKDPAAVLVCTVLEDSLKRLALSHGIKDLQGKELSIVTQALLKEGILEQSTTEAILSFEDLRNAAFNAEWEKVSVETVSMLLTFLPTFIEKYGF